MLLQQLCFAGRAANKGGGVKCTGSTVDVPIGDSLLGRAANARVHCQHGEQAHAAVATRLVLSSPPSLNAALQEV